MPWHIGLLSLHFYVLYFMTMNTTYPPVYFWKFSFLVFWRCSLRQKGNASTVILEAFSNADLLLFLVMTQLSAYISILIQCNWMLNKNKICLMNAGVKSINASQVERKNTSPRFIGIDFILFILLDWYFNFTTSIPY